MVVGPHEYPLVGKRYMSPSVWTDIAPQSRTRTPWICAVVLHLERRSKVGGVNHLLILSLSLFLVGLL
jgi:hypothetical protein